MLANLTKVCAEAWQYDNLRPTVARAVWPQGTMFKAPEVPVKQLSPASPLYRGSLDKWRTGPRCTPREQSALAARLTDRKGACSRGITPSMRMLRKKPSAWRTNWTRPKASYCRACRLGVALRQPPPPVPPAGL